MVQQPTRPDRALAASKRDRYCNTGEASRLLGGVISAGILRDMALRGEIKGAIQVRHRVLLPRHVVPSLVRELEFQAALPTKPLPKQIRSFGPMAV